LSGASLLQALRWWAHLWAHVEFTRINIVLAPDETFVDRMVDEDSKPKKPRTFSKPHGF
jgi:hypothetical protein